MNYTSAEAAKLLKKINEELDVLREREMKSAVFTAAVGEDIESVRPKYDYAETAEKLEALEAKVRYLKVRMHEFNLKTYIPELGMTIDEALVWIPQLSERKRKLTGMAARLPKERTQAAGYGSKTIIEYDYANYDIEKAGADLAAVTDLLAKAQGALDRVNSTATLELDI